MISALCLQPFGKVWGASAFKGADGPMRYSSNPIHYIRNNEAWTMQLTGNYKDFDLIQVRLLVIIKFCIFYSS